MQSYEVQVDGTGETFACRSDETVLAAMLKARCGPVTHGCCGGGCGICKMQVAAGRYEVVKAMSRAHVTPEELEEDIVLLCCIQPRSGLRLVPARVRVAQP